VVLDLQQLFRIARRRWWLLLLAPLVTGGLAFAVSSRQPRLYAATTTLMVNPPQSMILPDYNAILGSQSLAETYRPLVSTRPVLAPVVTELALPFDVDELKERVAVSRVRDTQLLQVNVSDSDPLRAAAIADAVARHFAAFVAAQVDQVIDTTRTVLDEQLTDTRRQIDEIEQQIERLDQSGQAGADPATQGQVESLRATLNRLQDAYFELLLTAQTMGVNAAAAQGRITVWVPAEVPASPYAPQVAFTTLLGVMTGLLAGGGVVGLHQIWITRSRPEPTSLA
jgi:uncharacterized protein involved in exopolysaccharide biosynthesis